jgi:hypothetical protein
MLDSRVLLGAGIAGALLLAVPVLNMAFGAAAPGAADAIVGLLGVVLLAIGAGGELIRGFFAFLWR